jgi:ribonucleotide reductase beta subunit family protein with ferritin-like domain
LSKIKGVAKRPDNHSQSKPCAETTYQATYRYTYASTTPSADMGIAISYVSNHLFDKVRSAYRAHVYGLPMPLYTLWECAKIDELEPLLQEVPDATPLALPYSDPELGTYVDLLRDSHWKHEEIHMNPDIGHYRELEEQQKHVLDTILRFFAIGDNLVVENLISRFGNEIKRDVVRTFYSFQIANEEEHKLTYARLINTIVENEAKRALILNDDEPALRLMADWINQWIVDRHNPFAERLLAFVFVEGVFFQSCFAFIFWLRARNLFPGLGKSNEFIARDENLHAMFACALVKNHVLHKPQPARLRQLVDEMIAVSDLFVDTMFLNGAVRLLGMNANQMKIYPRHVANHYLVAMGGEPLFDNVYNPFPFMVQQSLEGKSNFFETDVSEYKTAANVTAAQYSENFDF